MSAGTAIQIENKPISFDFRYFILIIGIIVSIYLLSTYIAKQVTETTTMKIEDVSAIAEEIYNSGETEALKNLPLDVAVTKKLAEEIQGVLSKTTDIQGCEVYFLRAKITKDYPVLAYGNTLIGYVQLNPEEVWKVGMTKNGEDGRYPNDIFINNKGLGIKLDANDLRYQIVISGSYKYVLIMEKLFIYTYPLWSGHPDLLKPLGCKIYK